MNDIFRRFALSYADKGLPVFPCHPGPGEKRVKRPLVAEGFYAATTDRARLAEWGQQFPDALIGLPTGSGTRLLVIDLDLKNGKDGFRSLAQLGVDAADHMLIRTPTGGAHLYCEYPTGQRIGCSSNRVGPGVDIRGNGGYVIAPPSRLADGRAYIVENRCPPKPFPLQLIELLRPPPPPAQTFRPRSDDDQRIVDALDRIPMGRIGRAEWIAIGMALKSHFGDKRGLALWDKFSRGEHYDRKGLERRWKSFKGSGVTIATIFHLSGRGNARAS